MDPNVKMKRQTSNKRLKILFSHFSNTKMKIRHKLNTYMLLLRSIYTHGPL